jgi:hypothetical protein
MVNLPEIQSILSRATYTVPEEPDKIIFHVFKAIQMLYDKLEVDGSNLISSFINFSITISGF